MSKLKDLQLGIRYSTAQLLYSIHENILLFNQQTEGRIDQRTGAEQQTD